MSRILLTGASGFIGRYVLKALLEQNHAVLAPTRNRVALRNSFNDANLTILHGSFDDPALIQPYQDFQPEYIVHLAAIRGDGKGTWKQYYKTNVLGTDRLVEFALDNHLQGFIHCSTAGIYGITPSRLPADPWTSAEPVGHYRRSKYMAERAVVSKLRGSVPFLIMRPTIPYGPGDRGFMYKLIQMIQSHRLPLVNKDITIHLIDVATIPELISRSISRDVPPETIVNLADQKPVKLRQVVDLVHRHFYGRHYPTFLKAPYFLYATGLQLGKLLNWQWLRLNLQMLSRSWYYETSNLESTFGITLKDTLETFKLYLDYSFADNDQSAA